MCIRDSIQPVQFILRITPAVKVARIDSGVILLLDGKPLLFQILRVHIAVSYTHLDVYKRQVRSLEKLIDAGLSPLKAASVCKRSRKFIFGDKPAGLRNKMCIRDRLQL